MREVRPTAASPLLHDLRSSRSPWVNTRDLAEHFHRSSEDRYRRLYRLQLIALANTHPTLIHRDPERGWEIEPGFAASLFNIPLPPAPDDPEQHKRVTELLEFQGDPAIVWRARRIREKYWIQLVRELANDAGHGVSLEKIAHRRREFLLLFNEHPEPEWWLARDPH